MTIPRPSTAKKMRKNGKISYQRIQMTVFLLRNDSLLVLPVLWIGMLPKFYSIHVFTLLSGTLVQVFPSEKGD